MWTACGSAVTHTERADPLSKRFFFFLGAWFGELAEAYARGRERSEKAKLTLKRIKKYALVLPCCVTPSVGRFAQGLCQVYPHSCNSYGIDNRPCTPVAMTLFPVCRKFAGGLLPNICTFHSRHSLAHSGSVFTLS